jgi:ferrous iron transport protein B
MSDCHSAGDSPIAIAPRDATKKQSLVAIVGPPNAGKTTLFNRLTGLRQKVANFPGVTVEHHLGKAKLPSEDREITLVDLPGVYSLNPRSDDERVTHDVLTGKMADMPRPNSVLLILDSTNLSRHLLLAAPVLSLGLPTLVILNMVDDLRKRQGDLDAAILASELGAPVALISAAKGEGLDKVWQFLAGTTIAGAPAQARRVELPVLQDVPSCHKWAGTVGRRADYKAPIPPLWTRRLDTMFLHPVAGPLVFLAVVASVFQAIFKWAKPLMDGVEELIAASGAWIGSLLPESAFKSLLIDGIWTGVGSVLVFLPQILLLFLFIGILEDSGYLARAALIADRTMARFGLQGKAFIPLLSAYACAVPAIMSARTIENPRDRLATIFVAPFMTCSARLPVYALLIAAFIPDREILGRFFGTQAAVMLGLYALGFLAAILTAKFLKSTILKSNRVMFILEMPPYRWPTLSSLGLRLYDRAMIFLRSAGTVILMVAVCLWVLANFPRKADGSAPEIGDSVAGMVGKSIEPAIQPLGFNWKIGIGLITSLAAREVMVGTLATIYGIEGGNDAKPESMQAALKKDLTPAGSVSLLIFFTFALQCMSTLAVVRRETGSWKWPAAQFLYMGFLAYVFSWAAFRIVSAFTVAS